MKKLCYISTKILISFMKKNLFIILFGFTFASFFYYEADPFFLFEHEMNQFNSEDFSVNLNNRPTFNKNIEKDYNLFYNSWYYYNDNAPNLENTSNRWVSRGSSFYNSIHLDYFPKFDLPFLSNNQLLLSLEPFFFTSENLSFTSYHTDPLFLALNDGAAHNERPYLSSGLRESQLILANNDFGIGYANTNMWWGPGLHNSLHMSNNTSGFKYFFIGTTSEKRISNIGYNFKYAFSKLDKNLAKPYFTGITADLTIHSNPIITIGLIRSFLSGGILESPWPETDDISMTDAMLLPFQKLFKRGLSQDSYDQTLSIFSNVSFPKSGLKLYFEIGSNDHRFDIYDFLQHPDHTIATIFGFRKYELFNNENLILGMEYTNLRKTRYDNRPTPNWYNRYWYDYNLYDGRRFTAHSGADSDDFYFYIGYLLPSEKIIFSIDYERHGISESVDISEQEDLFFVPEFKLEFKIDARKKINKHEFFIMYEFEYLDNLGIVHQGIDQRFAKPDRKTNVFGLGYTLNIK